MTITTLLISQVPSDLSVLSQRSVASAHASSLRGIAILSKQFVLTSSLDQRINLWELVWLDEARVASIEWRASQFIEVAAVCGLDFQPVRGPANYYHLAVAGVGVMSLDLML